MRVHLLLFLCLYFQAFDLFSQEPDTSLEKKSRILSMYVDKVDEKSESIERRLTQNTARLLHKWRKQETKIFNIVAKKDSLKAAALVLESTLKYEDLQKKFADKASLQQYIPSLDTLSSSLKFLEQNSNLLSQTKVVTEKLKSALTNTRGLATEFKKAEDLKAFLKQRNQFLHDQLSRLGYLKQLKKFKKQAYYYSAQVYEYKSLLKDYKKTERKALEFLSKTKLYKDFMRKHSMLSSLFRLPGDPADPSVASTLPGLQTRTQVNQIIQQQIAVGGPAGQQQLQQNLQAAQAQITQLKDKLLRFPSPNGDLDEAELEGNFKPNQQKTKSLWQRLEIGTNVQSQKSNGFFPTMTDLGLSLGYKLNDKSIIGIGGSYKIGWGKSIRHISLTHQGVSLRSFADWKIKGSFWLTGGFEMNYRSGFKTIEQLREINAWQRSGLLGLSKAVSLKTKFFKKTKLQLMWDFLSFNQVPKTQPFVFRIGYTL